MNNFALSFCIGLFCTASAFTLCAFIVIGSKIVLNSIKRYFPEKKVEPPPQKVDKPRKVNTQKAKVVRSIEIDPLEVDRIYVKKSS